MRSLARILVGLAVITAGGGIILSAGPASGAAALSVEIAPPTGQTAVKSGDTILIAGTVEPGAALNEAFIRTYDRDLQVSNQYNARDSIRIEGGQVLGSFVLPGLCNPDDPRVSCHDPNPRPESAELNLHLTVELSNGDFVSEPSNKLRVDTIDPAIESWTIHDSDNDQFGDRVEVDFSEPISNPDCANECHSPVDWKIEHLNPTSVCALNCTGTKLVLGLSEVQEVQMTEDYNPRAEYGPPYDLHKRQPYEDGAGNPVGPKNRFSQASDRIPPIVPVIQSVAGESSPAYASDPTPDVVVTNISNGHQAQIFMEADGNDEFSDGDLKAGQADAGPGGAIVTLSDLRFEDTYTFYALAVDPAGNVSPEASAPATYTLDLTAPTALFAALTDITEITVGFTEDVVGQDNPANWRLSGGGTVTDVTGGGNRRILSVTAAAPGETLEYVPGDYRDQADLALGGFTAQLTDFLPPLVEVTDPVNNQWVSTTSYTLRGTAERSSEVEIYRDDDGNGQPDGGVAPLTTAQVENDAWSAEVPLSLDSSNGFLLRGVRTDMDPVILGPFVRMGPTLVQDSTDPQVSIEPLVDTTLRGGVPVNIDWTASDENFSGGPIHLEYSKDDGGEWKDIERFWPNDPPYEWVTPRDTTTSAKIRITAFDLAGRQSSDTSSLFEIDSTPPLFQAIVQDSRHITLKFSEPVSGLVAPGEWKIDGEPVVEVQPAGPHSNLDGVTLTVSALADEIGPTDRPLVTYAPVVPEVEAMSGSDDAATDLEDHVGNAVARTALAAAIGTGSNNPGSGEDIADDSSGSSSGNAGTQCTIVGTPGADSLVGTDGPDVICPLAGADEIEALGGDDLILGGLGPKTVDGGLGNDHIFGGPDADSLRGGPGNDTIVAAAGDDEMDGGEGTDRLEGGDGNDVLLGWSGTDTMLGEAGNDRMNGSSDNDVMYGGTGRDVVRGESGRDRLFGEIGRDKLAGGSGRDLLSGGLGRDKCNGGSGVNKLRSCERGPIK